MNVYELVASIFFILLFSVLSFSNFLYNFLFPFVGAGWAYVIDQSFPLLVSVFALSIILKKYRNEFTRFIVSNKIPLLVLLAVILLIHGWLLQYYFFAEDSYTILVPVKQNYSSFALHYLIKGYSFFPFVLSFLLFGTNAFLFNVISLILFVVSSLSVYLFVYIISRKKIFALISALFFVTTPVYLSFFAWQATVQGMSLSLAVNLASLMFVYLFQKKNVYGFYILSLLFFAASLKMGFVRSGGIIFVVLFLLFFPKLGSKKQKWTWVVKSIAPYIIVWFYFIFFYSGSVSNFFEFFLGKKSGIGFFSYISAMSFYVADLLVPGKIGMLIFPLVKTHVGKISLVFTIGLAGIFLLTAMGILAFLKRKRVYWWFVLFGIVFIFSNIFFTPLFSRFAYDSSFFDRDFIQDFPPYGPGMRYLFFPAVGVAMLFASLVWFLARRGRKISAILLAVFIIGINGFITFHLHKGVVRVIGRPDSIFFSAVFNLVPRDGQKKLLWSANPKKNVMDRNVGGGTWLYGFYKQNELSYTNNREEVIKLINAGKFTKQNLYAFYNNPDTRVFKNITEEAREELFGREVKKTTISFSPNPFSSQQTFLNITNSFILTRAISTAGQKVRTLLPRQLTLKIGSSLDQKGKFPYSDVVVNELTKVIPPRLWEALPQNDPAIFNDLGSVSADFTLNSYGGKSIGEISLADRLAILAIIRAREQLRQGITIEASEEENDPFVSKKALTDGVFTTNPSPRKGEYYYLPKKTPSEITLRLPYPVKLGRLLLNVILTAVAEHTPLDFEIFAAVNGKEQKVGSWLTAKGSVGPNKGKLIDVGLDPVVSDSIKIVIHRTSGRPVIFDEIIVDDLDSLRYSPGQIFELAERNFWWVNNQDLLNLSLGIDKYRQMALFYVCAEDEDWERQKKRPAEEFPGLWNMLPIDLSDEGVSILHLQIDCQGTNLQKIILVGHPYPVNLKIEEAYLE